MDPVDITKEDLFRSVKYNALLKNLNECETRTYLECGNFVAMFMRRGNTVTHDKVWFKYLERTPDGHNRVTIKIADGNYSRDFDQVKVFEYDTGIEVFDIHQIYDYFMIGYASLDTTFEY